MGGSNFGRLHVWSDDEDVYASDLNNEFNNILNNLNPAGIDGYEDSVAQMKLQTSPGAVGTESLATSLGGELERLRYVVSKIIGAPGGYWYSAVPVSLSSLGVGNVIPQNRIVSGLTRSATDAFPIFLLPDGTAAKVTLKAGSTPFVYYIGGVQYTISTDVAITGMSVAPSSNNTALVNDTTLTGQTDSLYAGEYDAGWHEITMDNAGTAVTALIGSFAAFYHGATREYFVAYVGSTTSLSRAMRGCAFNSSNAPIVRQTLSDDDTLTLCKLHWIYATTSGTIVGSQTNPTYSTAQPTSPNTGDYWFNLSTQTWMTYNGSAFVTANATLIGWAIADSAGVKAARCFDVYAPFDKTLEIIPVTFSNTQVQTLAPRSRISVNGVFYEWKPGLVTWDTASNMESGYSFSASTRYYLYVSELGALWISPEKPHNRPELLGYYHPYHMWRALPGNVDTDGSTHFLSFADYPRSLDSTRAPIGGIAFSSTSGSYGNGTTTFTTICSITITTRGRPVKIMLQALAGANAYITNATGVEHDGTVQLTGTATTTPTWKLLGDPTSDTVVTGMNFEYIDTPAAGTYTYSYQGKMDANSIATLVFINMQMIAYEVGG